MNRIPSTEEENRVALTTFLPTPEQYAKRMLELTTNPMEMTKAMTAFFAQIFPLSGAKVVGTIRQNGDVPRIYLAADWYTKEELENWLEQLPSSEGRAEQVGSRAERFSGGTEAREQQHVQHR